MYANRATFSIDIKSRLQATRLFAGCNKIGKIKFKLGAARLSGLDLVTHFPALEPGEAARKGYLTQQVDDGMEFTVKASYWHRRDWFERELVHDTHMLVLVDEKGVETICLFIYLELDSDRPDLASFEEIGRFK